MAFLFIAGPESVLRTTRERVAALQQGIPRVTMPRPARFSPRSPDDVFRCAASEDFDFPFIVRMAGDHGGKSTLRVNNRGDYPALHVHPFDGRDFYLTEFVDCSLGPAGEMLIFEANPSMDFLTNEHPQMDARMEMIKFRIHTMLERHSGEKLGQAGPDRRV